MQDFRIKWGYEQILINYISDGDPKTKAACLSAGMDDLLVKPIKKE